MYQYRTAGAPSSRPSPLRGEGVKLRSSLTNPPIRSNKLPMPNPESSHRVPAAALESFMTDALASCGLPKADAAIVAGAMLDADLSGSDAHGVFRLSGYVRTLQRGHINPRANIRVIERSLRARRKLGAPPLPA